jgi:GntR family transcriptional repressor for pyruvate dehydrogenase complex
MNAVISREPEKARELAHVHLAYIEETMLDLNREDSRRKRSLRRIQQSDGEQ